jgi:hypothetical protein
MSILSGLFHLANPNVVRRLPPVDDAIRPLPPVDDAIRPLPPVTDRIRMASNPQAPMVMEGGGLSPISPPQLQRVPAPQQQVPEVNLDGIPEFSNEEIYMPSRPRIEDRIRAFQMGKVPDGDAPNARADAGGIITPSPDMFGKGVDPEQRTSQNYLPLDRARYFR